METDKIRCQITRSELRDRLAAPVLEWVKLVRQDPNAAGTVLRHFYEDTAPTEFAKTFSEWLGILPELKEMVGEDKQRLQATRMLYVDSKLDYLIWTGQTR